ncbi:hypothetical protein KOY49_02390 [Candidatus Minimicrobia vallesae]|uniref:Uncharacterized protein n=1 Tax=Candidatus Minimicrobia vallesae TaxID=2841264 RepID=A0A8F1SB01_9BACT|nr:hypothetical protein [Candidatus Minimicrobia vallesae]QWQ31813.1 hypothetical protein KOY49_02390 [Candidatus Minimicrobia vallesae]
MASKKKPANFKVTKSKNEIMTAVLIGLVTALIVIDSYWRNFNSQPQLKQDANGGKG